jgi:hypothetical protein
MKLPYDGMRCGNNGQFAYGADLDAALAQIAQLRDNLEAAHKAERHAEMETGRALSAHAIEAAQLRGTISLADDAVSARDQIIKDLAQSNETLTQQRDHWLAVARNKDGQVEGLKAHMRTVAGWLNNGCEPSKGAGELLLVAGLPPPQEAPRSENAK